MNKGLEATPTLSELELSVLGIVFRTGRCTPYQIRQQFIDSPTPSWSGSAGSIYPLVRRLEKRRLVESEADPGDGRRSRHYVLTESGRQALRLGLTPPLGAATLAPPADPLRTRVAFLDALEPAARATFLQQTTAALRATTEDFEARAIASANAADPYEAAVARGAAEVARARLNWFEGLRL